MNLEQQLREALRAENPGEPFTAAVMARIEAGASADGGDVRPAETPRPSRRSLWPLALAASLLLVFIGAQQFLQQRQQQRELAVRDQLEQALTITTTELNRIQQRLNPSD